jgi:hypothetical protein
MIFRYPLVGPLLLKIFALRQGLPIFLGMEGLPYDRASIERNVE